MKIPFNQLGDDTPLGRQLRFVMEQLKKWSEGQVDGYNLSPKLIGSGLVFSSQTSISPKVLSVSAVPSSALPINIVYNNTVNTFTNINDFTNAQLLLPIELDPLVTARGQIWVNKNDGSLKFKGLNQVLVLEIQQNKGIPGGYIGSDVNNLISLNQIPSNLARTDISQNWKAPQSFSDFQLPIKSYRPSQPTRGDTWVTNSVLQFTDNSGVVHTVTTSDTAVTLPISLTTQVSGVLQSAQFPTLGGDVTNSGLNLTLNSVNGNIGTFGSSTQSVAITVNAKGLITAVTNNAISGGAPNPFILNIKVQSNPLVKGELWINQYDGDLRYNDGRQNFQSHVLEVKENKGTPLGYASLDVSGVVPANQISPINNQNILWQGIHDFGQSRGVYLPRKTYQPLTPTRGETWLNTKTLYHADDSVGKPITRQIHGSGTFGIWDTGLGSGTQLTGPTDNALIISSGTTQPLILQGAGTTAVRINTTANIGIGTTNDDTSLVQITAPTTSTGQAAVIKHNGTVAGSTAVALRLAGNNKCAGLEMVDGTNLAVSNANEGRIFYSSTNLQSFYISLNGAAAQRVSSLVNYNIVSGATVTYVTQATGRAIIVRMVGGGGGGGGVTSAIGGSAAAGGGGAGGYAEWLVAVTPSTTYTVAVGGGGTAGTNAGGTGGAGGITTFTVGGTTVTANGGNGGVGMTSTASISSAAGGTNTAVSTNGSVNSGGGGGDYGLVLSATLGISGPGASCPFGAGGGNRSATAGGVNAVGFGSGGGGALQLNNGGAQVGGTGAGGCIVVEEYS